MSDRPYADEGEVRTTFEAIRDQIGALAGQLHEMDVRHTADHGRIEVQVKTTNGRVSRLEQYRTAAAAVVGLIVLEMGWILAIWSHR